MPALKLSEREKKLAFLTLGFVIFYFVYQFLLIPKSEEAGKLKDRLRGLRLELKVSEGKAKILETIEKTIGVAPERSEAPREERALEVLKNLSQAIAKSGLNLISIRPLLDASEQGLKFSLSCSGKYKNLYDFLLYLHKLRIMVLVNALEVTGGGQSASPVLDIKLTITAYY